MIQTPTTFVIGAGASVPYGLPTGATLLQQARGLEPKNAEYQLLHQSGIPIDALNGFIDDLQRHPAPSIDAYLESRQGDYFEQRMRTGRFAIAILMANAVKKPQRRPPAEENWFGYIFERMREGARDMSEFVKGNATVRFVTYNFDTIIEAQFSEKLRDLYPNASPLGRPPVPVIHVHGALLEPPQARLTTDYALGFPEAWRTWVPKAAGQIRVVLDQIDDETLKQAQQAIAEASVICFLGFGFARENLARLGMPGVFVRHQPDLFGSAFGLRHGEQQRVRDLIGKEIALGPGESNCLDVLRDFHILRG